MRGARWGVVLGMAVAACLARAASTSAPSSSAAKATPSAPAVATIGPLPISREDFERRASAGRAEFEKRRGEPLSDDLQAIVDRQILESLIRANLLVLEARRAGVKVSDAEAEAQLRNDPFFNPGGSFNAARFEAVKTHDPAGYRQAIERTRAEVAGRKLAEQVREKNRPDEDKLRLQAERALSTASVDYFLVPRFDLSGDYPEPREKAIVDEYRSHLEQYRRPARAVLSMLRLEPPAGSKPSATRERADSVLAAVKAGARFDAIANDFGGLQNDVVVITGNFPGYWHGDARQNDEVFRTAPGAMLAQPVPGERGSWLVARVDQSEPAHLASLSEAAPAIRQSLRDDARLHFEERELRTFYDSHRDSLKGPAYRIRYAAADTGRIDIGKPTEADLDRFYRAHLADYTSYNSVTAEIVARPLSEVRGEILQRWDREQRMLQAKALAERWYDTWSRGARDRNLERAATTLRDVGPVPQGAPVDTGLAARALTDTLYQRGMEIGVGLIPYARGLIVYHVYERLPEYVPKFGEILRPLTDRYRAQKASENEQQARETFDKNPQAFATGRELHFSRITFEPRNIIDVPLTHKEVERYHRDHIDKYSSPEQIHARHILISPENASPAADAAALKKANDLLRRVRAGEDFATLAEKYSDDPPTKSKGGDLGFFSRGTMLEPFERAAFAMKPGEVSEPVKTEVGYHLIKVVDHEPMVAEPLVTLYSNVGADAATEKAQLLARRMADSVYQTVRTPAQARAAARKLNLEVVPFQHPIGNTQYPEYLRPVMQRLESVPLGKLYPGPVDLKAYGAAILWPDSLGAPHPPTWDEARSRVLEAYMRDAGARAVRAKQAEIDSMLASGWSLDSVAALWGGWHRVDPLKAGVKVRTLGESAAMDSLVFGGRRAPALGPGQTSGWVDLTAGLARVRLDERRPPSPNQLAARLESERRLGLERNLFYYYEDLKKRYSVRILDDRLRDVVIPPPPPEPPSF